MYEKLTKFYTSFARKINSAQILRNYCQKNIFPNFGAIVPLRPSPVPVAFTFDYKSANSCVI